MPPLHHEVITAKVAVETADLRDAQQTLERRSPGSSEVYAPSPAGLGVTVAWGLPYFQRPRAGGQRGGCMPLDRARRKAGAARGAALPERPGRHSARSRTTSRSCCAATYARTSTTPSAGSEHTERAAASRASAEASSGARFEGGDSLPRQMAIAAGVPARRTDPRAAPSSSSASPRPSGGLRAGQDRELRDARLRRSARQRLLPRGDAHAPLTPHRGPRDLVCAVPLRRACRHRVPPRARGADEHADRPARGPPQAQSAAEVRRQFRATGRIGHSASIQTALASAEGCARRRRHPLSEGDGRADPRRLQHARQPVLLLRRPCATRQRARCAGVHFVVFNPSSDDFERNRLAMDGVLPDGALPIVARLARAGLQLDPRQRPTARTSSCRPVATAASRSPSSEPSWQGSPSG